MRILSTRETSLCAWAKASASGGQTCSGNMAKTAVLAASVPPPSVRVAQYVLAQHDT